jgi:succinate dehydrogenase/fumarate reductase flavoprotein subunit
VAGGEDIDFHRFGPDDKTQHKIEQAPFYAVQMFPMTRKSMGGVAVDRHAQALKQNGDVFPGLYAVGELNGSVGINGKHGLDGMFLGPAILTGRLAGRSIATQYADERTVPAAAAPGPHTEAGQWQANLTARNLEAMLAHSRDGYWHFEMSHKLVLERGYECKRCHSAQLPFAPVNDRLGKLAQTEVCTNCH